MALITKKTEWDLSPLLNGDDDSDIDKKLEEVKKANFEFIEKWRDHDDYIKDPKILKQALDEYEKLIKNHDTAGDPGYYFHLRFYQDQINPKIKAKQSKIEEMGIQIQNERQFFMLKISKIPKEKQTSFLESEELKEYKHLLEKAFERAKHLLSDEEEKILNLKESTSHDYWEKMTSSLIAKQEKEITIESKKETKNFSELLSLTQSKNGDTRLSASKALNEIFSQYSEVAEPEINSILANHKINDELRKFPRPDSARHLEDDISTETVDTLIKTVTEKFWISKKFYELKTKLLKIPKLKYSEKNTPYGRTEKKYNFEEAVHLTHKTFKQLDEEFSEIFESFLKNGQIDAFPKKGKREGAFCIDYLPIQPCYVLLNHTDSLKDVKTIAHEMGHAINHEFMKNHQNALNISWPKSVAEVASTFMEDFIVQELLKEASEEEKLEIMMQKLDNEISTIFRQTAFYNFETELHKKFRESGYLSKEEIGEMFVRHMNSYLGESIDTSEANNWWIYIPHFRYMFYVYSYASGLLISKVLQERFRKNPKFIKNIKEFLSAGTSASPEDIFNKLDIDITKKEVWCLGLKELEILQYETEKLGKKLGKI